MTIYSMQTRPLLKAHMPVLDAEQDLALEITQYTETHQVLDTREAWQITDLEQRTARLIRGAGPTDPSSAQ